VAANEVARAADLGISCLRGLVMAAFLNHLLYSEVLSRPSYGVEDLTRFIAPLNSLNAAVLPNP